MSKSSIEAPAQGIPSVLERILSSRKRAVAEARARVPEADLRRRAALREARDFKAALRGRRRMPAVIAELKRRSPSAGRLREDFDVAALAAEYEAGGAAALSVLTEEENFEGRLEYLQVARAATRLPILRKDFIFCPYQIWEAAAAGADAVLLIAAMLDDASLQELRGVAEEAGLAALCEVHDENELRRVGDAALIGINSRDLHSLRVDLGRGLALGSRMRAGAVAVAESGLRTNADLERAREAGFHAVLVGEHLMRQRHPGQELTRMLGGFVKICGLANAGDAEAAMRAGADAVGFVFAPASPRRIAPNTARATITALPKRAIKVGVFAGVAAEEVATIAADCGLDAVQLHGEYSPEEGLRLAQLVKVWRAVAMPGGEGELAAWAGFAERAVLDSAAVGGTGRSFDWRKTAACGRLPLLLAGGLNPENVARAIGEARGIMGVDVASGVESAPGRKDHAAIERFVSQARAAFQEAKE
ncbi:MAG TPA: indole-3-glycerol phosphate synthase TrpC [Terriglobales bacterium]|nr:indole-3-glycerol phosphate synthase TrpC [Terriglobales bacterium]